MTAIGIACSDGTLASKKTSLNNQDLGLPPASDLKGNAVKQIAVTGDDKGNGIITITYGENIPNVSVDSTLIYTGICNQGVGSLTWQISGSIPPRFLPRT